VTEMEKRKKNLKAIFEIKKLWVSKERKSSSQRKYVLDFFRETGMSVYRPPADNPMHSHKELWGTDLTQEDTKDYLDPDIAFSVNAANNL